MSTIPVGGHRHDQLDGTVVIMCLDVSRQAGEVRGIWGQMFPVKSETENKNIPSPGVTFGTDARVV